jgi:hypothetical protein
MMANLYWPFDLSTVTEWAGSVRSGGVVHMGTDFGVAQGAELRATVSGRITRWNNDGLGAYVLDIIRADGLLVRNAHLSRMDVNTGDQVVAGQVIGLTGGIPGTLGAGNTTGAHLHWELRWDRLWQGGSWFDPRTVAVDSFTALAALDMKLIPSLEAEMFVKVNLDGGMAYLWNMATGQFSHISEIPDYKQIDANFKTFTFTDEAAFTAFRGRFPAVFALPTTSVDSVSLAASVASAVGNVNVNVDALASAIAKKLGAPESEPITKADVQAAIEANYKESK